MDVGDRIREYVLDRLLGAGGAGEVWVARHRYTGRSVALKAIYLTLSQDPAMEQRVVREARVMSELQHPHIVQLHEFFFLDERPYLVMDFVEGGSLQAKLDRQERLSPELALAISRDVLGALDFAHRQRVVHRDVKPLNILVDAENNAFLTDFGIALIVGAARLTRTKARVGTPEYMSPEQFLNRQVDHRTDVYSFGCVLYEMLTGHPPFGSRDKDGITDYTLMERHLNDSLALDELRTLVDEHTVDVIARALEKDPEKRLAGCAVMAQLLDAEATPEPQPRIHTFPQPQPPIREPPPTPPINEPEEPRPRRLKPIMGILGLAILALLFASWVFYPSDPTSTDTWPGDREWQAEAQRRFEEEARQRAADEREAAARREAAEREAQARLRREEEARRREAAEREAQARREAEARRRQEHEARRRQEEARRLLEDALELERRRAAERARRQRQAERERREQALAARKERVKRLARLAFNRDFEYPSYTNPEFTEYRTSWQRYLRCNGEVDYEFFRRHPERNDQPITQGEPDFSQLAKEWREIRDQTPGCN